MARLAALLSRSARSISRQRRMSGVTRETKQSNSKYPQPIFGHFPPPRRTRLDTNADKSRILSRSNLATRDFGLGNQQIFTELRNRKASDSMGQAEFCRCLAAVGISRIQELKLKRAGATLDSWFTDIPLNCLSFRQYLDLKPV